ncbi:MAG: substrate-binding domain-containing protein [Planctomyces sp.]|nr:substrate-binding domain-containing protein [Planctomyces sp.]
MRSGSRLLGGCLAALCVAFAGCKGETPGAGSGAGGSGGGASGGAKRIVILTNGDDPFWDACEAGAKQAEKDLDLASKGFRVAFERADFTDQGQIDKLKQYNLQRDIAGVGISVFNPDSRAVTEELRQLQQKGVQVVTIDGDLNREKFRDARYAYIGTDNIVAGRELGKSAAALRPDGKHVFFVGSTTADNAVARMEGFNEGAGASFQEIERLEDGADRPKARQNVESALDRHRELNALVGIWAYNTPQIVSVVQDRRIRDAVSVLCFDAAEASIREMEAGNVDVMVVQNPFQMGYDGVRLLVALAEKDDAQVKEMYPDYAQEGVRDIFRTDLRVVVPNADSPISAELFEEGTVFMPLDEFRKWLADRGLVSS